MTTRLYLITPPTLEPRAFAEELKRALGAGDVACLQLRLKDASDEEIARATETLMPVAQKHDTAFILNDRPDLAAKLGCDGVHVGQSDARYAEARAAMGPDRIVGVTCHGSRDLAFEAGEAGADYVAFGSFFPTTTKEVQFRADIDLLAWWAKTMTVPVVAIGGITVENCAPLIEAGADFLAVSSGVWNHDGGPAAAVRAFNALFAGS
ncbi:MAG: thiamine phosphate synthase [Alphaproteobacteria bacterium]|nr:thiamine phosphate synthase [Alphaproteobacteria bacterium]MBV9693501.1 thiamine phosphate synthase [Alphaproteobacteria bacterium]